jgi:hypothetical protein
VSVDSFWGIEPSASVARAPGAIVGRWESVELLDDERLDLRLPEARRVTLPQRRVLGAGRPLLRARLADGSEVSLVSLLDDGSVQLAFDPDIAVAALIAHRQYTRRRPLAARLPFNYRRVPAPVRNIVRDLMTRRAAALDDGHPAWPLEPSVETLRQIYLAARMAREPRIARTPFWPAGKRFAIALTHDVDSADGLALAREIAAEETARGERSCWYLVGRDYPLDHAAIDDLRAGGSELGLHGAHHDNRIAFLDREKAAAELDSCRADVEALGMRGFRSPSMLRTPALYELLEDRFAYDSSMPDTGLLPERNGCGTVFPFRHGKLAVLPLTLAPDGQLLGQGLDPAAALAAWIAKAEWIASVGGMAIHLTHPEPGFSAEAPMREAYRRFLDWTISRDDAWRVTPAEIAEHWGARGA